MSVRRVIVTGGSGFVGTNLVSFFDAHGWDVLNLDVAGPRNPQHTGLWREVDLLDRQRLVAETRAFAPTVFLHFGARTDLDETRNLAGYAANIEGVCNVLEAVQAAPSIQRVVFASSQLVCRQAYDPRDAYDYCPSTLYGLSKSIAERIVRAAGDVGVSWTIVRPTSLWGPWFGTPYRGLFTAIAKNRYVHPGPRSVPKQWGYIGNAAFQICKLAEAPANLVHGRTFYLADYEPVDLRVFAEKVQVATGARNIKTLPTAALRSAALVGDILIRLGWRTPPMTSFRLRNMTTPEIQDIEPLRQVVGAELPYTLDEGIDKTVQWLRLQHGS